MENREIIQLISLLLQYPSKDILAIPAEELEQIANKEVTKKLLSFTEYLTNYSLEELKQKYVETFDFNEKTNLYLTYSKLKEERERGQILVRLKQIYEDEGYFIDSTELPDYLPLFLEFVSVANTETTKHLFLQFKPSIEDLRNELINIQSPYGELVETLIIVSNELVNQ